jgi:hypothetical protein
VNVERLSNFRFIGGLRGLIVDLLLEIELKGCGRKWRILGKNEGRESERESQ